MDEANQNFKQVYWIDDNVSAICSILQSVFVKLWNLGGDECKYKSNMIIFGNGWRMPEDRNLLAKERQEELNKRLRERYREECENVDNFRDEKTFSNNKELINNAIRILINDESGDYEKNLYREVYDCWVKENLDDDEKYLHASQKVDELINLMKINEGAIVFIDIELLFGDLERLNIKEDDDVKAQRIISMELYKQLSDKGIKCFFYSSNVVNCGHEKAFKKIYRKKYHSEAEISVYDRNFFTHKGLDYNSLQKIFEMN